MPRSYSRAISCRVQASGYLAGHTSNITRAHEPPADAVAVPRVSVWKVVSSWQCGPAKAAMQFTTNNHHARDMRWHENSSRVTLFAFSNCH